jgi:hypothetical protein
MATQVATITLLILGMPMPGQISHPMIHLLGRISLGLVVIFALLSAADYFRKFWTKIDVRFKARERRRLILLEKRQRRHVATSDIATH